MSHSAASAVLYQAIGSVTAGSQYRLRADLRADRNNAPVELYLQQAGDPYDPVSDSTTVLVPAGTRSVDYTFTATTNHGDTVLIFGLEPTSPNVWFDNISLVPVDAEPNAFSCSVDAGQVSWSDAGSDVYWVYRSTDGGAQYSWIGRWKVSDPAPNPQLFTDRNAVVGALYQVDRPGAPRVQCPVASEPGGPGEPELFSCSAQGGQLTWTDAGSGVYWMYRSTDGGATFNWIGRWKASDPAPNPQTFTDPNPAAGAVYQIDRPNAPRVTC